MSDIETKRQNAIRESDQYGSKQRFGLFSHPISNAVGDNGQYQKKKHPRDPAMNQPITQPRNFYTSPPKKGKHNSAYFTAFASLASSEVKDKFEQPAKREQREEFEARNKGKRHEVNFFTGAGNKVIANPSYPYIQQKNPELDPRKYREDDGRVKSQPKNFYTNQASTVDDQLFKGYEHLTDPYNRAEQLERERRKKQKSFEPEQSFKPNNFCPTLFEDMKQTYGEVKSEKVNFGQCEKEAKQTKFNIYRHEMAWKISSPNKKGIYGYFSPFPAYKESPAKPMKITSAREKAKQALKLNSPQTLSSPTPSISLNRSNLVKSSWKCS